MLHKATQEATQLVRDSPPQRAHPLNAIVVASATGAVATRGPFRSRSFPILFLFFLLPFSQIWFLWKALSQIRFWTILQGLALGLSLLVLL